MFIEIHRGGERVLVNTARINRISESEKWFDIGDFLVYYDETYDEIREMIKKVGLVVAEEESK